MAVNFPGPYELRIFYTATISGEVYNHTCRLSMLNVDYSGVGDDFDTIEVTARDASVQTLDVLTDNLIADVREFHSSEITYDRAELWEYEEGTFNAFFVSTYTVGVDGSAAASAVLDSQTILSFRTSAGGIAKLDLRHTSFPEAVTETYPTGSAFAAARCTSSSKLKYE